MSPARPRRSGVNEPATIDGILAFFGSPSFFSFLNWARSFIDGSTAPVLGVGKALSRGRPRRLGTVGSDLNSVVRIQQVVPIANRHNPCCKQTPLIFSFRILSPMPSCHIGKSKKKLFLVRHVNTAVHSHMIFWRHYYS